MEDAHLIPPAHARDFLAANGWGGSRIEFLAGDASFRRYFRVFRGHQRGVLMDSPPEDEDPRPFIKIANWLEKVGLEAPRILATDLDRGLLLLNDLGNESLKLALDYSTENERELYEGVTDVLVHLHEQAPPADLDRHFLDQWMGELDLFTLWYLPAIGMEPRALERFHAAWREVLEPVANDAIKPVVTLRDYHAENIMLVPGEGIDRFALLDFQDAVVGHPAYDLVSVLEDARRDVSPQTERAMIDRYVEKTGSDERFERAYWALGAQRNVRILGVFCRLSMRDGKHHYRKFQPRMWGLVERNLAHPTLAPVREWFDENIPAAYRADFWKGEISE